MSKQVELTRSEFAENFLYINGQPFCLENYPFMRRIYDSSAKDKVLKFSRQTGKSSSLANFTVANCAMIPNYRTLYVSPSVDQTKIFSNDRVKPAIEQSPFVKKYLHDNKATVQNVFNKEFLNGSRMYFKYVYLNADRIRGISADEIFLDECYTPNMEVLTKKGWKKFSKLTLSDYLATADSDKKLEFQKPNRIIEKEYDGDVLDFSHMSSKVTVTPGHNMFINQELNTGYYKNPKNKGWRLIRAEEAENMNFKMSGVVERLQRPKPVNYVLPGFSTKIAISTGEEFKQLNNKTFKDLIVDSEPFIKFLGWFLAEGHCGKTSYSVTIVQNKGKYSKEIRRIFEDLNLGFNEYCYDDRKNTFTVHNPQLWNYCSKLVLSGDKYIPKDIIYNYTGYLKQLLSCLYKGDAIKRPGKCGSEGELTTISKQLADDTQLCWMLLGRRCSIRTSDSPLKRGYSDIQYRIRPLQKSYQVFWNAQDRVTRRKYKGKVYCATVPNGTLVVRDKDERGIFISGNCQDLITDTLPVIRETMTHSEYKRETLSGTPKRTTGTLADAWFNSTMYEYVIKCEGCNKWNILNEDNIGLHGLICGRCGHTLSPYNDKGQWVSTHPNPQRIPIREGYRICALHFAEAPWVDWSKDIIYKMENTSKGLFFNETLAIEHDTGAIPITREELIKATSKDYIMNKEPQADSKGRPAIMGIDYGPVNSENSNTVISIVQPRGDKLQVVYAKKFVGKEASYTFIHDEIPRLMQKWNCQLLAADYGMGEAPNSEFRSRLGVQKVIAFQHLPTQKERMRWQNKMQAYTLNRNQVFTQFFRKLKNGNLRLPEYESCEEFINEIRNVQLEYDEDRNKLKYVSVGLDDFVHATIFAMMSAELLFNVKSDALP